MSSKVPANNRVERSNAAEHGDRANASSGLPAEDATTRLGRVLTTLVGAGVLLTCLGAGAFAVGAVLELGALVQDVMALVSQPEPAAVPPHAERAAKPPRAKPPRAKPSRAERAAKLPQAAPTAAPDAKPAARDAAVTPESTSLALNVATAPASGDIEDALLRPKVSSVSLDANDANDAAEASEKAVPLSVTPAPPLARVECPEVFVYIVSVVDSDPKSSVASLGIGHDGPARLRHLGDRIGTWEVAGITDDWSGLRPEVWLVRGETYCRARLAGNPSRVHSAARTAPAPRARKATPPARQATPRTETATPRTETATPPTEAEVGPTEAEVSPPKKAKKAKARRRRRRRH